MRERGRHRERERAKGGVERKRRREGRREQGKKSYFLFRDAITHM